MKKIPLITLLAIFINFQLSYADSVTYIISATIPAIAGVNAPDESLTKTIDDSIVNEQMDKQIEIVVRNNKSFLLETIVAL